MTKKRKKLSRATHTHRERRRPDLMDMEWQGLWPSREAMLRGLSRIASDAMMGGDSPYPPADDWRNP